MNSFHTKTPANIKGLAIAGYAAGLKKNGALDLMVATLPQDAQIAGVFTRSQTTSYAVDWCRRMLPHGKVRAIVANSGGANVFTGQHGIQAVEEIGATTATALDCSVDEVYQASTGVIGEPLQYAKIIKTLAKALKSGAPQFWLDAASAIMTTDTYPKLASQTAKILGKEVAISGIAKGSGMIAPNMATTLGFVFTDACIPHPLLQQALLAGIEKTFNCITVDSDTSTSDTVLLAATGGSAHPLPVRIEDIADFSEKLELVLQDLATQVVRDGEGANKLITIRVTSAENFTSARRLGLAIGNSPLVKTAIAGEDGNWGRVLMAVGKSGVNINRERLSIQLCGIPVLINGEAASLQEADSLNQALQSSDVEIAVDIGVGSASAVVWSCDLTHEYISINADYRS